MTLRGAIVGCGMISEFHRHGWQRIPEVEIVALVDPVRERAKGRRAQFAPVVSQNSARPVAAVRGGDVEAKRSCKRHRIDDIGDIERGVPGYIVARQIDQQTIGWMPVDQAVVHPPPSVVARVGGLNQLSRE